jgi:hypothetical protein
MIDRRFLAYIVTSPSDGDPLATECEPEFPNKAAPGATAPSLGAPNLRVNLFSHLRGETMVIHNFAQPRLSYSMIFLVMRVFQFFLPCLSHELTSTIFHGLETTIPLTDSEIISSGASISSMLFP